MQIGHENEYDSVRAYFEQLKHDGTKRLGKWLLRQLGTPDTPLNSRNVKRMMVAGVARVFKPGAWVNLMPILVGPQRAGKSSFLRLIARDVIYFTDTPVLRLNNQQRQEALRGKHIIEVAELAGWKASDIEWLKAFVSMTHDSARRSYDRLPTDQPRRGMFVGTSNDERPLKDATGNARFPIIAVGKRIQLKKIEAARDQLWAEAKELYQNEFSLDLPQSLRDADAVAQRERMEDDPWLEALVGLKGDVVGDEERVCYSQIFAHLGVPVERQTRTLTDRASTVMVRLGWKRRIKNFKYQGKSVRGFKRDVTS